ncbi:MAG TPA: phytanoyl-CoA dioxygenase family protein [Acidobacteriaceae bacterium]
MAWREQFEQDGFAIAAGLLNAAEVEHVLALIKREAAEFNGPRKGGARDVLELVPELHEISHHTSVLQVARQVLGEEAFVVRATLFDKTPDANWKVPWHQDLTIAVEDRREVGGYGPWSLKAGVHHVQPPTEVLQGMVTVRIHLDACPPTNGALRVMPGSHRFGRVSQNDVEPYVDDAIAVICAVGVGDALVMRPLLFHASSASREPGHRRVLHFDYAAGSLAGGLRWRMRPKTE